MPHHRPRIGITVDNANNTAASGKYECGIFYAQRVAEAGGVPLLLPHRGDCVADYVDMLDGVIFTGGVDPDTQAFGETMHPSARRMDPARQAFETALLDALRDRPKRPVLGVCLGMQLMALHAGGRLHQYLPDMLVNPDLHKHNNRHGLVVLDAPTALIDERGRGVLSQAKVVSYHQQAVADAGTMRVVARAPDGVIEAIDDPRRKFCVGVQWHPERGDVNDPAGLNARLVARFVAACRP